MNIVSWVGSLTSFSVDEQKQMGHVFDRVGPAKESAVKLPVSSSSRSSKSTCILSTARIHKDMDTRCSIKYYRALLHNDAHVRSCSSTLEDI